MSDNSDPKSPFLPAAEFAEILAGLARNTHAGDVLVLASQVEQRIELLIQYHMPNLSNRTKPRMFEGFGPLASFSAKIEVAHALGYIEEKDKQLAHAIREIRNKFAHTKEHISFENPDVITLVGKLPNKPVGRSDYEHYVVSAGSLKIKLEGYLDDISLVNAVRDYAKKRKTSQEKSPSQSPHRKRPDQDDSGKEG